ncbi:MAG: tetratricopeptide repeat protein [Methanobacteriaceae archaeon]|nr:tetratricopeptide repeat protein [Methanobacteriaceae archaeon]
MDMIFAVAGAMFLAYAGILMIYYHMRLKERHEKTSKLMLNGVTSFRRGVYEKALAYFKIAYQHSEKIKDYPTMAEALYHMGLVYQEQDEVENAVVMFHAAAEIYNEINDAAGVEKSNKAADSLKS